MKFFLLFFLLRIDMNITLVIIGTNFSRWAPLPKDIRFNKVRWKSIKRRLTIIKQMKIDRYIFFFSYYLLDHLKDFLRVNAMDNLEYQYMYEIYPKNKV